jgi:Collagen triple helix repeat (20 copies)
VISRIHQRLGTAGFVIAIVALIAALSGGAYAASGGLSSKQKKEVEKIAKSVSKPGTAGATGPAGTPGAKGDAGSTGAEGKQGSAGNQGSAGTSAEATSFTGSKTVGSVTCTEGGIVVKSAKPEAAVCNGAKGQTGFTEKLPSGKTETGTWAISLSTTENIGANTSVSFPIPLAAAGAEGTAWAFSQAEVENEEWGKKESNTSEGCVVGAPGCKDTGCRGSVAEPTAPKGTLCVYAALEVRNAKAEGPLEPRNYEFGFDAYGVSGAFIAGPFMNGTSGTPATFEGNGTWAVTAP